MVVRELLAKILSSDPGISVIGAAKSGEEALLAVARDRPDVITMDIHMPGIDGLETTRRIMETQPTPIVIVSGSTDAHEVATVFQAMEAGALAVLRRPPGIGHPEHESSARELVQPLTLMSAVKLVRRWAPTRAEPQLRRAPEPPIPAAPAGINMVAIGASTGGPPVLQTILSELPKDFPAPILIVQHMAVGFCDGFAEWLAQSSALPVHVAMHGEVMRGGHVYVAPDDLQMKVGHDGRIQLTRDLPENGLRPSVSYLFRSLAEVSGKGAVAGLLSGMGRDGAEELKLLRDRGAITFAQDEASSVVDGMPGEAIRLGAATYVLHPDKIAPTLAALANNRKANKR